MAPATNQKASGANVVGVEHQSEAVPVHAALSRLLQLLYLDDSNAEHVLMQCAARHLGLVKVLGEQRPTGVIEHLRNAHECRLPDLLLLDYQLAGSTSLALLRWIRSSRRWGKLPVVMYSGSDDPQIVAACYAAGANAFLCKPATLDRMRDILMRLAQVLWSGSFDQVQQLQEYRG